MADATTKGLNMFTRIDFQMQAPGEILAVLADLQNVERDENKAEEARKCWLSERAGIIGGSEAATVACCNPYESPLTLWAVKSGAMEASFIENEAMEWGRTLERIIGAKFAERNNFGLFFNWPQFAYVRHPSFAFMACTPDGFVFEPDDTLALVQLKTCSERVFDGWHDEIPLHYAVQCQHEMACTNALRTYLVVLVGGQRMVHYVIDRDDAFIAALELAESDFWNFVVTRTEPPISLSAPESGLKTLAKLHPQDNGMVAYLDPSFDAIADELLAIKDNLRALEERKDALELALKQAIGPNTYGVLANGRGRFSLKTSTKQAHMRSEWTGRTLRYSGK